MKVTVEVQLANSEKINKKLKKFESITYGIDESAKKTIRDNLLRDTVAKELRKKDNEISIIEIEESN